MLDGSLIARGGTQASASFLGVLSDRIRAFSSLSLAPTSTLKPPISCESRQQHFLTAVSLAAPKPTWQNFWQRMRHGKLQTLPFRRTEASDSRKNTTSNASSVRPSFIK